MRTVLKRASTWFLMCVLAFALLVGALFWYYFRLANPCPPDGMLNGEPVTCYCRVQYTGVGDWPWILAALALVFGICLLCAWVSAKRSRSDRSGKA